MEEQKELEEPKECPPWASRFFNGLLREWPYQIKEDGQGKRVAALPLEHAGLELHLGLVHHSPTGRHRYSWPCWVVAGNGRQWVPSFAEAVSLITKEMAKNISVNEDIFVRRVLESAENSRFFEAIWQYQEKALASFIDAEAAMIYGHPFHPAPKLKEGFGMLDAQKYSPESGKGFALCWFAAKKPIVHHENTGPLPWERLIEQLAMASGVGDALANLLPDEILFPVHPFQARFLLEHEDTQALIAQQQLRVLGVMGNAKWRATSSVRTLYHPDSPVMIKCALNVRITNAVRTLFHFEALRSKSIDYFKQSAMGQRFLKQHPCFHLLSEWAHMALTDPRGQMMESSLLLLRENPFGEQNAIMLATLCEEKPRQNQTHLAHLINTIARQKTSTIEETALAWFVQFLKVYLDPLLGCASHCGFLISAHQQNALLALEDGWPTATYIRDGQGTAFVLQKKDNWLAEQSKLAEASLFLPEQKSEELFGYYVMVNGVFNVIAALDTCIAEARLFLALRHFLEDWQAQNAREDSGLCTYLLTAPFLSVKGNFLTFFHDIQENASRRILAPYVTIANPIAGAQ